MWKRTVVWVWWYSVVLCRELKFPDGFKLGTATASYQIEGGWNAQGKGENVWDRLTHTSPNLIADRSTGDIACNSYQLYETDIKNLKYLNVDHYRFSLSWSRILPNGFDNRINPSGVTYYNNLIDGLIANGIEPMVTLYHWDLPQPLQDLGGWTNPLISDYFADFAKLAFDLFGDRVKRWITINEPASICVATYEDDVGAPAFIKSPGIGLYLCGKTILLAHAKAYHIYDKLYRMKQGGKIGITIDSIWAEPQTNSTEDIEASDREMQFGLGWWAHPIYSKQGDYPAIMKTRIAQNSKEENFTQSRLPQFTPQQTKLIQGSADFLGLNHYHTWFVTSKKYLPDNPSYQRDKGTKGSQVTNKFPSWGFRKLLNWVKDQYDNPLVIVTENGYGDKGGLQDMDRILFLNEYMKALLLAVLDDHCNVNGYTVWSVMDNMEWRDGYTIKFGLFDVNFTDPQRTRTKKMSVDYYKHIIQTRVIPDK